MKIIWDAQDVQPGIVVGHPVRKERWMIGYISDSLTLTRYTLNSLIDGMVLGPFTKRQIADKLTEENDIPAVVLDNSRFKQ